MATEQSLFGATPESIQQARDAALNTEAAQYAQMDPFQRASFNIYRGANQLGGAVGGMLGGQDPQMLQMQKRQQLIQGINPNDPDSLKQAIERAMAANDYPATQELSARLQALLKSGLEGRKTEAEILKLGREKAGADPIQQLLRAKVFTSDSIASYSDSGNIRDLLPIDPALKTQVVETKEGQILINSATGEKIMNIGMSPERGVKVTATASASGEKAGAEQIAKLDAKRLSDANISSDKALEAVGLLTTLANTPQPISGAGAPARVAALRVLDTLGLTGPKDRGALQNADTFNSLAGERVLSFIKQLGSNPTDTDREFARTIGPALEKGTKTNQDLINYLSGRANDTVKAASAMEKHFYDNNYSLKGFQSPLMKNLQPPSRFEGMSDAELAARIKNLQGK